MDNQAKRAFSVLATVSVLAVAVFGVVAFTAVPVTAPYVTTEHLTLELMPVASGRSVGDPVTVTVRATNTRETHWEPPNTPEADLNPPYASTGPASGVSGNVHFSGPESVPRVSFVTDSSGMATVTHVFSTAGTYTISASAAGLSEGDIPSSITVIIAAAPSASTPTPNNAQGGDISGGDGQTPVVSSATPTATARETALENVASAIRNRRGVFWILVIAVIVLLAIIATALVMRRRG